MRFFEATSQIKASPEAVWSVLVDGASWASWDSGVDGVDGRIAPGETIKIRTSGRGFPVKVTAFDSPRRLTFTGGMPLGLFRGVRTYSLTTEGDATTFHMREEYTGPMLPLIW